MMMGADTSIFHKQVMLCRRCDAVVDEVAALSPQLVSPVPVQHKSLRTCSSLGVVGAAVTHRRSSSLCFGHRIITRTVTGTG